MREKIPTEDFYVLFMHTLNVIVEVIWSTPVINKLKMMIMYKFGKFTLGERIKILELIEIWKMIYYNSSSINHN